MPIRRRVAALKTAEVDPEVFRWGNGCWSYFDKDPVYVTEELAKRAWQRCRRIVWAGSHVGRIPRAAIAYDDLTDDGPEQLIWCRGHIVFPTEQVLAAIDGDRQAVADFRERSPRAARSIGDFLGIWLAYLDRIEALARQYDDSDLSSGRGPGVIGTKGTFGDAVQASADGKDEES